MKCTRCGALLTAGDMFCGECGSSVSVNLSGSADLGVTERFDEVTPTPEAVSPPTQVFKRTSKTVERTQTAEAKPQNIQNNTQNNQQNQVDINENSNTIPAEPSKSTTPPEPNNPNTLTPNITAISDKPKQNADAPASFLGQTNSPSFSNTTPTSPFSPPTTAPQPPTPPTPPEPQTTTPQTAAPQTTTPQTNTHNPFNPPKPTFSPPPNAFKPPQNTTEPSAFKPPQPPPQPQTPPQPSSPFAANPAFSPNPNSFQQPVQPNFAQRQDFNNPQHFAQPFAQNPATPAVQKKKESILPALIVLFIVAAAAAAGLYFMLTRDKPAPELEPPAVTDHNEDSDSSLSTRKPNVTIRGSNENPAASAPASEPASPVPNSPPETAPPETAAPDTSSDSLATEYPAPLFTDVLASAVTPATQNGAYDAICAVDGLPDTAWNYPGSGSEWIMLLAPDDQYVTGVRILNGYTKYSEPYETWLYYRNHRPCDIFIELSDGTIIEAQLEDIFDGEVFEFQTVQFPNPVLTSYIKITVNSVYLGDRWDDTCISEIEVY